MKENVFTTKLRDIIIDEQYNSIQDIENLPAIFLVMDYHKLDLRKMIKIQKEFRKIEVKINIKKSYVMQITTSGHMKSRNTGSIMSFPITKSFKYLGCRLDQAANFKEELSNK